MALDGYDWLTLLVGGDVLHQRSGVWMTYLLLVVLFVWIVLTRKLGRIWSQDRLDSPAADAGLDGRLPDCCPIVASLGEDLWAP